MKKPSEIELLAEEYYCGFTTLPWIVPELWEYNKEKDALILSKKKLEEYLNQANKRLDYRR